MSRRGDFMNCGKFTVSTMKTSINEHTCDIVTHPGALKILNNEDIKKPVIARRFSEILLFYVMTG